MGRTAERVVAGPGGRRRLEFECAFPVDVGELWAHLTSPDRLPAWFGELRGDPRPGAVVQVVMTQEEGAPASTVAVQECEPPRRLAVDVDGWELELDLDDGDGTGSALRFAHVLGEDLDPVDVAAGWRFYLDRLAWAVDGGAGAAPAWEEYAPPPG